MKKFTYIFSLIFITTLLFITFNPTVVQSQDTDVTVEDLRNLVRNNIVPNARATQTIGSPYFFENYREGYVTLYDGNVTEPLMMNYNVYENQIEFVDGSNILAINAERMGGFTFTSNENELEFKKGFKADGLDANEFVQVLSDGPVTALLKHDISFLENVPTYGSATQVDEYTTDEQLYIHKEAEGETERIRRVRERNILRAIDSHQDQMEQYVEENRLDLRSYNDIKRFFDYYNSLSQ